MSITYNIELNKDKIDSFHDVITEVTESVYRIGTQIISDLLERLDTNIRESIDTSKYRNKGKRKNSIKTRIGVVEYSRTMYMELETGLMVYPLDNCVESNMIGLIDEDVVSLIEDQICVMSYRETANCISKLTGMSMSHQAVWNVVQEAGKRRIQKNEELTKLNQNGQLCGAVETEILYEEADGNWLSLQGKDRKQYGPSKEMKMMIAYDGVEYTGLPNKKVRKTLDNKVAYASFEPAASFRKHKNAVIASKYDMGAVNLRVKNGDGAQWIQNETDCRTLCVLDKFHRNKKIKECIHNTDMIKLLTDLVNKERFDDAINCIEAYINSITDEKEISSAKELYRYYTENREALSNYFNRGVTIPPTRDPGRIHHARLGSMESNVFTLIGNRMKGRRACWSIEGGNNLAIILCARHTDSMDQTVDYKVVDPNVNEDMKFSVSMVPKSEGKGYECPHNISIPANLPWMSKIAKIPNILN